MIPGLGISMTRDKQHFVIIKQVESRQFGCVEEYGPLCHLSYEEMSRNGLMAVLKSLEEYSSRVKTEQSELESLPGPAQQTFQRTHRHVGLSLRKPAELWIEPMHFGNEGGMIGGPRHERAVVELPTTQELFFDALLRTLALAD